MFLYGGTIEIEMKIEMSREDVRLSREVHCPVKFPKVPIAIASRKSCEDLRKPCENFPAKVPRKRRKDVVKVRKLQVDCKYKASTVDLALRRTHLLSGKEAERFGVCVRFLTEIR